MEVEGKVEEKFVLPGHHNVLVGSVKTLMQPGRTGKRVRGLVTEVRYSDIPKQTVVILRYTP